MKEMNFTIKKLKQHLNNFESMDEQEKEDAMKFVLNVQINQFEEVMSLVKRTQDLNESLHKQNTELKEDILFYQDFIQDSNLGKRYAFYCRTKGVI